MHPVLKYCVCKPLLATSSHTAIVKVMSCVLNYKLLQCESDELCPELPAVGQCLHYLQGASRVFQARVATRGLLGIIVSARR